MNRNHERLHLAILSALKVPLRFIRELIPPLTIESRMKPLSYLSPTSNKGQKGESASSGVRPDAPNPKYGDA